MPQITYVSTDNTTQTFDVPVGTSVMRGALMNDVDGIAAECGGYAQCATCHVYVAPESASELKAMEADEDGMLEFTASERLTTSRLSCQLEVTDGVDGLVVVLPARQIL
ncbi:ferredoxin [Streptacidiphilus pinicola]|uniref:Ferredoxin n=1 Tax=Streptacidiphilus pinicola TaxID=2219663 RepID=A0A2X0INE0_9ACTN|nr:2Fe-2S iron-sulfur cluster-binding protein [Streptacidiphilus pinicola]RAG85053.1 ferredoxin [Streptacidiphilus pinicola]